MRWRFPIFVFSVLFAFVFGLFITTGDTYAVSDISVSYTQGQSVSSWSNIFSDCTGSCLGQYRYLVIDIPGALSANDSNSFYILVNYSGSTILKSISQNIIFAIYELPFDGSSTNLLQWRNSYSFSYDITVTLTADYQSGVPFGNIDITENGQYDVTNYATATVNIPAEVIQGDYHDDLVSINNSIIICAAVCLVLYFFYCIYRLIIRNSGVK